MYPTKPLNAGLVYLFDLYQDKQMVLGINEIFLELGTNRAGIKAGAEYWTSLNRNPGPHLRDPAIAVDLRLTNGIKELLEEIKASGQFNLKTLFEKDHYHVEVRG